MISMDSIRALCRQRIDALHVSGSGDDPSQFENQVVRLVEENTASGRFQRLVFSRAKGRLLTLADYIDLVIFHAQHERARLLALEEGDTAEWNRLRDFLYRRACRMTSRFRNGSVASTDALDFAQQACLVVFAQRYPCDVSFDAWATTILKNLILAHYTRSPDVLNQRRSPNSLDAPRVSDDGANGLFDEMVAAPQSLAPFEKVENQTLLLDAIARLRSMAQRQVITWTYLDQLDDGQIARRLRKNKPDVYNLRHRALLRLKQILAESSQ
jgi:RNA polymerase sigma factor (sigma-70 family)